MPGVLLGIKNPEGRKTHGPHLPGAQVSLGKRQPMERVWESLGKSEGFPRRQMPPQGRVGNTATGPDGNRTDC